MIRAIFFDWFNTLAHYEPPRHLLHGQACREIGFEVSLDDIQRGVLAADRFYFDENIRSPVEKRSSEEKTAVWVRYQEIVLAEAGIEQDESDSLNGTVRYPGGTGRLPVETTPRRCSGSMRVLCPMASGLLARAPARGVSRSDARCDRGCRR